LSLFVLTALAAAASATYNLGDNYYGSGFFDMFNFETFADPTHGFVQYVSQATAKSNGLIRVNVNDTVIIRADHKHVASSSGRMSVRLTSKASYNTGLFLFDLNHIPAGICGTWPAIWTLGPNWPNNGEIDILEGVNTQTTNTMTLHTSDGCTMSGVSRPMTGSVNSANCYVNAPGQASNQGCGVQDDSTKSYGDGFNNNGGGIYAVEWTTSAIKIWFFPRGKIPSNVYATHPDPSGWTTPDSVFPLGSNCPSSHFNNHNIVLDLTFCGDWAGAVFSQNCPNKGSCNDYVQNNPSAFLDAFWSINSFKVYN